MRQILLILVIIFSFSFKSKAQSKCTPSDSCGIATTISCYNGFISTTAGYNAGSEPIICPNGQSWAVHNDLWIKFIPTQSNLEITIDVIGNCSSGSGIQALIHESCNTDPIDCDVDCGGSPSVGSGLIFVPGKEYFLRIDGCSGAICPFQITVNPSNAIATSSSPIISNLSNINGLSSIGCPSEKIFSYCTNYIDCVTEYNWKIESGNAIITSTGEQVVDLEPLNPGKNIIISGAGRNCINIKYLDTGYVNLSVIGSNGCQFTNQINKIININKIPNKQINVAICPNMKVYKSDSLPGGPFLPGYPCGNYENYEILNIYNNGCNYNIKLSVKQLCDTSYNLGEIVLCPDEKFEIGGYEFDSTSYGIHKVFVNVNPAQNANTNPPLCDSTNVFFIIPAKINHIIYPLNYQMPCANNKVTLNAKQTYWSPTNSFNTLKHQWQRYYPDPNIGWKNIAGANADTLLVDEPSKYRLITSLDVMYKDGNGNLKNKICSAISKEIIVTTQDTLPLQFPKYSIDNTQCIGIPYHIKIENPDPNLQYTWIKIPQNDTIKGSELTFDMVTPYQILGFFAKSDCKVSSIRFDTIYNIRENQVVENIALQGYNTACVGNEIGLRLINYNNYKISLKTSDSLSFRILGDSVYLNFKYPGIYQISFNISTLCNARTIVKTFYIDESVQNTIVFGLKTVIEKSTNIYCNNNSNPNFQTKWLTSKNLKFKNYNSNPNCIAVTFPKGISTGWIKSTVYNNCSEKSDSIFVLSKPKFFTEAIEEINSNDISINERYQHNEMSTMMIIPNPAINSIELKATSPFDEIEIIDILGSSKKMMNENNIFDISNLNSGFYIVKIFSNNKEISKNTFIKIN